MDKGCSFGLRRCDQFSICEHHLNVIDRSAKEAISEGAALARSSCVVSARYNVQKFHIDWREESIIEGCFRIGTLGSTKTVRDSTSTSRTYFR